MKTSFGVFRVSTRRPSLHYHFPPTFLCPALLKHRLSTAVQPKFARSSAKALRHASRQRRSFTVAARADEALDELVPSATFLPLSCPGCGAFSQTVESNEAGFYSTTRSRVTRFIQQQRRSKPLAGYGQPISPEYASENAQASVGQKSGADTKPDHVGKALSKSYLSLSEHG